MGDAEPREFAAPGFYLGGGGGALIELEGRSPDAYGYVELLLGYRMGAFGGMEFDVQCTIEYVLCLFMVQGKIYPAPYWRVQPHLIVGAGGAGFFERGGFGGGGGALRGGIGVDIYLTRHLLIAPVVQYNALFGAGGVFAPGWMWTGATLQYRF
jgi:hypothetical protein